MASEGTLVFVLGGVSSAIPQGDETALIHVLDTSTYSLFVPFILDTLPSLKTQSTSSARISTPTLSSLVRTPPNLRRCHPRVP